ncbi:MAG: sigma-70 family RNA polymerase sigma factor [Pirellulales bacterium]|nr:sigma-70 family RNA polymerase sigma factor [Pirellulales bacterium]
MADSRPAKALVERWRSGDQVAAQEIYRRYARRLCAIAEQWIDAKLGRRVEADDIVQSVFQTFFRRTHEGEYQIDHSGALWKLLVQITLNKVRKQAERHHAAKRDVASEVCPDIERLNPEFFARDPSHEEVAAFLDELEFLTTGLVDPEPEIVRLCLEGYSAAEIATEVGCTRWTVRRVLARVGERLQRRMRENLSD